MAATSRLTTPVAPSTDGWNLGDWSENMYPTYEEPNSGTDTDTVSSIGDTWYEYEDIPEGLTEKEQGEELFWAYQRAKGRFRKFMRKPVRRVRRFMKRKGKGKGKHPGYFLTTLKDQEIENLFFGKGRKGCKGKGKRSSGKGRGRRQNPKGRDGQIMKDRL